MKLTKDNYYSPEANRRYMSVSQFKGFLPAYGGCEARSMAELAGEYTRPDKGAFNEGHYIHAWNEGTLSEYKAAHPEIYSSRGNTKGQLKSEYRHLNKMIEALETDELVMRVLSGQKEVVMTAQLFGIQWKIMIDSYQPVIEDTGAITDLKALKSLEDKFWNREQRVYENAIDHYGYNVQMAVYAEVEKQNKGRKDWAIPHMVIATKQDPPDKEIIYFDYAAIESGLQIVRNNIERVKLVKSGQAPPNRCGRCDYCRQTKKAVIRHYGELAVY